ncbi:MAG TPA: zinc-ribbon domain-containing protein [archaeon]|nr:zinc-ribbon domain-containing protein [archaeon]
MKRLHNVSLFEDVKLKCPNCGAILTDVDYQFCEVCGIELSFKRETNKLNSKKTLKSPTRRKHCC